MAEVAEVVEEEEEEERKKKRRQSLLSLSFPALSVWGCRLVVVATPVREQEILGGFRENAREGKKETTTAVAPHTTRSAGQYYRKVRCCCWCMDARARARTRRVSQTLNDVEIYSRRQAAV